MPQLLWRTPKPGRTYQVSSQLHANGSAMINADDLLYIYSFVRSASGAFFLRDTKMNG